MVFYFKSTAADPPYIIYVGAHKEENESLIKYGLENDLCSAHVYLRLQEGDDWKSLPQAVLTDCAQLTKANSIEGNKKDNITVIYTPWSNLKKTGSMATGQVGFHDDKLVRKQFVAARENAIVNRLNKTKEERFPDLRAEKEAVEKEARKQERIQREQQKAQDRKDKAEREAMKFQKDHAYDEWQDESNMRSNENYDSDDFM